MNVPPPHKKKLCAHVRESLTGLHTHTYTHVHTEVGRDASWHKVNKLTLVRQATLHTAHSGCAVLKEHLIEWE